GALREVYGFIERELNKLEQRRPDLAVLAQSPQSRAQLEQDPEGVAILSHPLALAQREEQMQQQMNRQGAQQIYGMFGLPGMGRLVRRRVRRRRAGSLSALPGGRARLEGEARGGAAAHGAPRARDARLAGAHVRAVPLGARRRAERGRRRRSLRAPRGALLP